MSNFESENQMISSIFQQIPNQVTYQPDFVGISDEFLDFAISSIQNFLQSLSDHKVDSSKAHILTIIIHPIHLHQKHEWLSLMKNCFDGLNCSVNFKISADGTHSINIVFSSDFTQTVYNFLREQPEYERR